MARRHLAILAGAIGLAILALGISPLPAREDEKALEKAGTPERADEDDTASPIWPSEGEIEIEGEEPGEASDAGADGGSWPALFEDREATGTHWRLTTRHGPIHVWLPPGYRHETAGIVLYVHGYYTDVDGAWADHRLAEKFRQSRRNALFIAPEAPSRGYYKVRWNDVGELIREVRTRLGLQRPWGPIVAMGHSGAYRTLMPWLRYELLDEVILLDALYAHEAPFRDWLKADTSQHKRLTMIAIDTLRWSELLARELASPPTIRKDEQIDSTTGLASALLDWLPEAAHDIGEAVLQARLVYIRSQYGHMELVEQDTPIPVLLQMTALEPVIRR